MECNAFGIKCNRNFYIVSIFPQFIRLSWVVSLFFCVQITKTTHQIYKIVLHREIPMRDALFPLLTLPLRVCSLALVFKTAKINLNVIVSLNKISCLRSKLVFHYFFFLFHNGFLLLPISILVFLFLLLCNKMHNILSLH